MARCTTTLAGETLKIHTAQVSEGHGQPGEILSAEREGLLVACGEQALRLTHLQLPNGKALAFSDLLNSKRIYSKPVRYSAYESTPRSSARIGCSASG